MLRFVQLSDPHLRDDRSESKGVWPNRRFARAVAQVNAMRPLPAFCILTGDLVAEETPAHYAQLKALCAPLRCPVHFCLGNHDDPVLFRAAMGPGLGPTAGPHAFTFSLDDDEAHYRFIVLDSHVDGEVSGALGEAQLSWLAEQLRVPVPLRASRARKGRALVFVHHPAVPLGSPWMDAMRLADGEALLDVLTASPLPVGRVLFGHVHQPITLTTRGLTLTSAPSTGYQFTDEEVTPKVYPGTAGYLVVTLTPDVVTTTVVPILDDEPSVPTAEPIAEPPSGGSLA